MMELLPHLGPRSGERTLCARDVLSNNASANMAIQRLMQRKHTLRIRVVLRELNRCRQRLLGLVRKLHVIHDEKRMGEREGYLR